MPIVRQSRESPVLPAELSTRLYFNLKDGPNQSQELDALAGEIMIRCRFTSLGRSIRMSSSNVTDEVYVYVISLSR